MLKSVIAGSSAALVVVAVVAAMGCTTLFGPSLCGERSPGAQASATAALAVTTKKAPARHAYYVRNGVPAPYRGRLNPLKPRIGNVIEGARLYDLRCAVCHGMMGVGDGEAGDKLVSPPADLGASLAQPLYGDDFFYWTIADGGAQFATDMPPFKHDLTQPQIWKIVTFMRAAFAEHTATPTGRDAVAPP